LYRFAFLFDFVLEKCILYKHYSVLDVLFYVVRDITMCYGVLFCNVLHFYSILF